MYLEKSCILSDFDMSKGLCMIFLSNFAFKESDVYWEHWIKSLIVKKRCSFASAEHSLWITWCKYIDIYIIAVFNIANSVSQFLLYSILVSIATTSPWLLWWPACLWWPLVVISLNIPEVFICSDVGKLFLFSPTFSFFLFFTHYCAI